MLDSVVSILYMINLVSLKMKSAYRKQYLVRLGTVFCVMVAVFALGAMLLLMPRYFILQERQSIAESQVDQLQSHESFPEHKELEAMVKTTQDELRMMRKAPSYGHVSQGLQFIVTTLQEEGFIDALTLVSLTEITETTITFEVAGTVSSRNDVLQLVETLKQDSRVVTVDVPISNFVQSQNIPFRMHITLNQEPV